MDVLLIGSLNDYFVDAHVLRFDGYIELIHLTEFHRCPIVGSTELIHFMDFNGFPIDGSLNGSFHRLS